MEEKGNFIAMCKSLTVRERVLAAIACVAVVLACIGFGFGISSMVPADAAGKVNDTYIKEEAVAEWISQYRVANGLTDDEQFAQSLISQDLTVATFRQNVINQLALATVVIDVAGREGVMPSDDEVRAQLDEVKSSIAFGDDEVWKETLENYELTEADLMDQYRANIAQRKLCEKLVPRRDVADDEVLAYVRENLAGSTQKHAYRIVFTGDDANERASECYDALRNVGNMSADEFAEFARRYSDEDGAQESGGSYAWSGANMSAEAKEILESVPVNTYTGLESVNEDDAIEIFYVDQEYTFPSGLSLSELKLDDIPAGLIDDIAAAAADAAWVQDGNAYLASLLVGAQITYYPVPAGAAYNVDLLQLDADENQ